MGDLDRSRQYVIGYVTEHRRWEVISALEWQSFDDL